MWGATHTRLMSSLTPAVYGSTTKGGLLLSGGRSWGPCLTLRRLNGRVNEGTWVAIGSQHLGKVVFFLLQVVLGAGNGSCPVVQAPDQTPLDMGLIRTPLSI